jgi:hypothetical protein
VLLRLAYLAVTNIFAVLRLLPISDRGEDTEILALRHQLAVLEHGLLSVVCPGPVFERYTIIVESRSGWVVYRVIRLRVVRPTRSK